MNAILLAGAGLCTLLLASGGMLLIRQLQQNARLAERVQLARGLRPRAEDTEKEVKEPLGSVLMRLIASLGQVIVSSGIISARTRAELEQTLTAAGLSVRNGLALFVGCKLMLAVLAPLIAWVVTHDVYHFSPFMGLAIPFFAGVGGLLLPDMIARKRRDRYLAALELGLPDALDMMVICAQAGLGMGAIIPRVGTELEYAHPQVAREFALTADEMQVMTDPRIALTNLGTRTGLENFRRLGTTLIQTMQYGTPLRDALRSLSAEMRQEAMTRMEARAARLPVLLTLPMVLFILPSLFMVVGGPAFVHVWHTLAAH